jgi:hypothetical protein
MARPRTTTRLVVENCLPLWIVRLPQGRRELRFHRGNEPVASIEYERTESSVRIRAQVISFRPILQSVDEHFIDLCNTAQSDNDAIQQWFLCACGQRVAKLYLPPAELEFRCRKCYNLTYRSTQTHDARLSYLARHPDELAKALHSPKLSRRLLAVKAALLHSMA